MKKTAFASRAAMAAGIVLALGAAVLWPWRMADGGDAPDRSRSPSTPVVSEDEPHRSPIALALSADGTRLLSANQTAGTVSLVDTEVRRGCSTSSRPVTSLRAWPSRKTAVAAWSPTGTATTWRARDQGRQARARPAASRSDLNPAAWRISADGSTAYVAIGVTNEVARVDLNARKVTGRLPVGREPRGIALTPDGSRLLVSNARSQNVSLIDVKSWKVRAPFRSTATTCGRSPSAPTARPVISPTCAIADFATTRNNIDLGWVLGQRLTRVPLDGSVIV